jgi:hypothetical protein
MAKNEKLFYTEGGRVLSNKFDNETDILIGTTGPNGSVIKLMNFTVPSNSISTLFEILIDNKVLYSYTNTSNTAFETEIIKDYLNLDYLKLDANVNINLKRGNDASFVPDAQLIVVIEDY